MRPSDRARRLRGIALVLALSAPLGPARAVAQGADPIALTWNAPDGCPDAATVRARIRELAGSAPASGSPLHASGTVTRGVNGFQLELVIRAGELTGTRNIEGRSCTDLAGAAAVALVLLLRSSEPLSQEELAGSRASGAAAGSTSPTSDESSASGAQVVPAASEQKAAEPPSGPSPKPAPPSPRRWRGLLQLPLLALGLGPVGGVNLGGGLAGGVLVEPWRFAVEGRGWLRRQATTTSDLEEYGADLDRLSVTLRACRSLLRSSLELAPCVSLSVEHLTASGYGPQIAPASDGAYWLAIGAGGQARLPVAPWLTLMAGVDVHFQTSLPEIVIEGVGTVGQVAPVAATVMVGPEWIL